MWQNYAMIKAENVTKTFKFYARPRHWLAEKITGKERCLEIAALRNVSLCAAPGECLGVIGSNGAGKSTLLRVLAGISAPTSGAVMAEGRVSALLELDSGFHPEFTGRENLRIGSSVLGLSRQEARAREEEIIAFSGLADYIDFPVRTYSSGMYLRLGFSLATAVAPDVFLVDEALAVGDEWFRGKCVDRVRRVRDSGAAVVIVSHDLTMVRALCDKVAILRKGEVVEEGRPTDAVNRYLEILYEEAAAEAGREGSASGGKRRGTGELEIGEVRLLGRDMKPAAVIPTGEPFAVEFDYRARKRIEGPLFGVNLFRSDGVLAVSNNCDTARTANLNLRPEEYPGESPPELAKGAGGVARFRCPANPLLEGAYEVSVNVFRGKSGAHVPVEEVMGAVRFQVVSGRFTDRGLFVCPGKWEIEKK